MIEVDLIIRNIYSYNNIFTMIILNIQIYIMARKCPYKYQKYF